MKLIRATILASAAIGILAAPASAAPVAAATWSMNEVSGTVMTDSSGNANNGALQHVALGVPGFLGTGYGFNGTTSRVIVKNAATLNPGTADFSITVHVASTTLPVGDADLLRKGYSTTTGGSYKVEIVNVSGVAEARCYFHGSLKTYQKTVVVPNLLNGAYHSITCQKLATTAVMTVDGKVYKSTTTIGTISNTSPLVIGAYSGATSSSDWFKGSLDEVSITSGS